MRRYLYIGFAVYMLILIVWAAFEYWSGGRITKPYEWKNTADMSSDSEKDAEK